MNIDIKTVKKTKLTKRQKALRFMGLEFAIVIALLLTGVFITFFAQNRILIIQKKGDTAWQDIAMRAQGEMSACQIDLQSAINDKDTAIMAANPDLK